MELGKNNPANVPDKALPERRRIPMSLPSLKLAVPDIPGYHLHWMAGTSQRIQQAQNAGYEFVEKDEVQLNSLGIADSLDGDPGTDLGSRISVYGGEEGGRLYLMKLKEEFWEEDQAKAALSQERIAGQLRGDKGFVGPGDDQSNRYSKSNNANLFQPKRRS